MQEEVEQESDRADGLRVRVATADDATAIAELGAAAFTAAFGPANPPGVVEEYVAEAFAATTVAAQLADPSSVWLVASDGAGTILGMAHLQGGDAPPEVAGHRPIQLSRLYAAAGLTSRGVGSELMGAALARAADAGHDAMWLGVWEHNPRAVAFYRRWGFVEVGTVVFRLGDDDQTDLVMARALR
jgi:ribosomal protein S18 acetylase RimI-like enzyme